MRCIFITHPFTKYLRKYVLFIFTRKINIWFHFSVANIETLTINIPLTTSFLFLYSWIMVSYYVLKYFCWNRGVWSDLEFEILREQCQHIFVSIRQSYRLLILRCAHNFNWRHFVSKCYVKTDCSSLCVQCCGLWTHSKSISETILVCIVGQWDFSHCWSISYAGYYVCMNWIIIGLWGQL